MARVKPENMCRENAEAHDGHKNPICYDYDSLAQYIIDEYFLNSETNAKEKK